MFTLVEAKKKKGFNAVSLCKPSSGPQVPSNQIKFEMIKEIEREGRMNRCCCTHGKNTNTKTNFRKA